MKAIGHARRKKPMSQNNKTLNNNNMKSIITKSTLYLLCLSQNQHFVCCCICDAYRHLFIECSKTYFLMQCFSLYPFIDSEFSPVGYFILTSCDIFPTLLKEDSYESTCFNNLISPTKIYCYRHWRACRGCAAISLVLHR